MRSTLRHELWWNQVVFIVGKSAALLVTVDNIKDNHGKTFAVTNGWDKLSFCGSWYWSSIEKEFQYD